MELYIVSVGLWPMLLSMKSACAIIYCHLWSARLYRTLSHYLVQGIIFLGKKFYCT